MHARIFSYLILFGFTVSHICFATKNKKQIPNKLPLEVLPRDIFFSCIQFIPAKEYLEFLGTLRVLSKEMNTKIEPLFKKAFALYATNEKVLYNFFILAVENNRMYTLRHLIEYMKGEKYKSDVETAMHIAASRGHLNILKELESHPSASIESMNRKNETVTTRAIKKDQAHILHYLLNSKKVSRDVNTVLKNAIMHGRCQVIKMLSRHFVDINKRMYTLGSYSKATPLFLAVYYSRDKAVQTLLELDNIQLGYGAMSENKPKGIVQSILNARDEIKAALFKCPKFDVNKVIKMYGKNYPPLLHIIDVSSSIGESTDSLIKVLLQRKELDTNVKTVKGESIIKIALQQYLSQSTFCLLISHPKTKLTEVDEIVKYAFEYNEEKLLLALARKGKLKKIIKKKPSVMAEAAKKDWFRVVKKSVEFIGRNVNEAFNDNGKTYLLYAIDKDDLRMVKELLKNPYIDLNIGNPIACAAEKGRLSILRALLKKQDKINDINKGYPLASAIQNGHCKIAKLLLKLKGIDINAGGPLARAIKFKRKKLARILINFPNTDVNKDAPLARAAHIGGKFGQEMVGALLEKKDINVNKSCPLVLAIKKGHNTIVDMLLSDPRVEINCGDPLGCAVERGDVALIERLSKHPDIDLSATYGLKEAAEKGNFALVKVLVETWKVDINTGDPLCVAIKNGHKKIVQFLLEQPGIRLARPDENTKPLFAALKRPEILKVLLNHPGIDVNELDEFGDFALIHAVHNNQPKAIELLLTHPKIIKDKRTRNGKTAYLLALEFKFKKIAKLLAN